MYQPPDEILKRYADVLVKFALHNGEGVFPGEVVQCMVPDVAKPLLKSLHTSILEAGAHPMLRMIPTGFDRSFFSLANDDQLTFLPKKYHKARVHVIDHSIGILAETDLKELAGIDPQKIIKAQKSRNQVRKWMMDKENRGEFTWTLALYGTEAMAREVGLSLPEYWQEIINACYLDDPDPIAVWKRISNEQERIKKALNHLPINTIRVIAPGTDLRISIGEKRQWLGGGGRNIPSFEIFTSPDWRGTEGFISFDQPLYRYGNIISGIRLEFKKGKVVKATADQNEDLLQQMIAQRNADKVGEFSMTDSRMSNIHHFMATTLFDENVGGRYGNTHIAVGMAYNDAYAESPVGVPHSVWKQLGFNDSGEHCDIIATTDRTVTATLHDGSQVVLFADGRFQV